MIAHAAAMLAALTCLAIAIAAVAMGFDARPWLIAGAALGTVPAFERAVAGARTSFRFGDPAAWWFPAIHFVRDVAWVAAIAAWSARRIARRNSRAAHSMLRTREAHEGALRPASAPPRDVVVIIPAYNEAPNLPHVVDELRRACPDVRPIVVDDGSEDETPRVLQGMRVDHLRLGARLGVGGAVRAGLRYARILGCEYAVRIDGDGQHRPSDVQRVLTPVLAGAADLAVGARRSGTLVRPLHAALAACLTIMTRTRVTDPTSGPRAVRLLAVHHPTGYAEPELRLLAARNGLRVCEVPIVVRRRLAGRTSLTAPRAGLALARTLLALIVVPLRAAVEGVRRE
jgi:hypothetical protein